MINHEVGHWLGFGHADCPGEGRLAPVMQQQSIQVAPCRANPLAPASERQALADGLGVPVGSPGPPTWYLRNANTTRTADVVLGYGDAGDIRVVGDWNGDGTDTPGVVRADGP